MEVTAQQPLHCFPAQWTVTETSDPQQRVRGEGAETKSLLRHLRQSFSNMSNTVSALK